MIVWFDSIPKRIYVGTRKTFGKRKPHPPPGDLNWMSYQLCRKYICSSSSLCM